MWLMRAGSESILLTWRETQKERRERVLRPAD
jgi:hypothetical protein